MVSLGAPRGTKKANDADRSRQPTQFFTIAMGQLSTSIGIKNRHTGVELRLMTISNTIRVRLAKGLESSRRCRSTSERSMGQWRSGAMSRWSHLIEKV